MAAENRPQDPRDEAIRAAPRDATTTASVLDHTIRPTYQGALRDEYIRGLRSDVEDLGRGLHREGSPEAAREPEPPLVRRGLPERRAVGS